MSGVQGKVREQKEYIKKTGFFEGEVVAINPDREKLESLLGVDLEKDPEYLGSKEVEVKMKNEAGEEEVIKKEVTKCDVVIWVRDVETDEKRSIRFYLQNIPKINKDKNKKQFINNLGTLSWADKKENLEAWFTKRGEDTYRQAFQGEDELYRFLTVWLGKMDFKDANSLLSFDWNKFMKGNVKELIEQIGGVYSQTVVCLNLISVYEKDGETKEAEQVYNRDFLPGYIMKEIKMKNIDSIFLSKAQATEKKKRSKLQKFVIGVKDEEWGIKDYYTLGVLKEYDSADNVVTSDISHIKDGDTTF